MDLVIKVSVEKGNLGAGEMAWSLGKEFEFPSTHAKLDTVAHASEFPACLYWKMRGGYLRIPIKLRVWGPGSLPRTRKIRSCLKQDERHRPTSEVVL